MIEINYAYDPLCGWCYGFSPVIRQLHEKYHHQLTFNVLSGGMVVGERVGKLGEMADYIEQSIPRLEQMTGVSFGEKYYANILRNPNYIANSEKPCVALTVFKSEQPEKAIYFISDLQKMIFFEGLDPSQTENYRALIDSYGIDFEEFSQKLESEEMRYATYQEFGFVQQVGVKGFPTTFLVKENQGYLLAHGYATFEKIDAAVQQILTS